MTNLEAALLYASWGWHVLPVLPNAKAPACQHGVHDATTDEQTIRRWFADKPQLNVGIAAGEKSGLVVFDIDPRNGGEDSFLSWLERVDGELPDTQVQLTAGGGLHYLFAHVEGLKKCSVSAGIDLLSDGGYFLAWPSRIGNNQYQWELSSNPIDGHSLADMPNRWVAEIATPKKSKVLASEIIQGNRNSGLLSVAGAMRAIGLGEAEILASLQIVNEARCQPPLPASEVRQIAKNAAGYGVESDVAANAALGDEAADALLGAMEGQHRTGFFLTRATELLRQPTPLRWTIKGWLPDQSLAMVYGESGAGKSFITIDMACSISHGLPWMGRPTKQGVVVYCAGEGNFGISQRLKAWCQRNGVDNVDNVYVSNKPIDIDGLDGASQVLKAVTELTGERVVLVVIDTLNNHMSGDENTAKDTRKMVNNCVLIGSHFQCSVILNHHMGHGANDRARGSSAWKASLDSAIQVQKKDDSIKIECKKMKDAREPEAIYGELCTVPLDGWLDEDGGPVASCVVVESEAPIEIKKQPEGLLSARKKFEDCWYSCGQEFKQEKPFVSRSAFREFLATTQDWSGQNLKNHLSTGKGKTIGWLIENKLIEDDQDKNGWVVVDEMMAQSMVLGGQ